MDTSDNPGKLRIQWHRFNDKPPLHPMSRMIPHPAFQDPDLRAAIIGEEVLLVPYEPIDGLLCRDHQ
jgi:hypothetical protein